jgi:hypothetical protein
MGDAKRRKLAGHYPDPNTKSRRPNQVIATHEAGHAVARVLTAEILGREPEDPQTLSSVDIYVAPKSTGSYGERVGSGPGIGATATTYGAMFSAPMDDFLDKLPCEPRSHDTLAAAIADMRRAGIDVDKWFFAKAFVILFGPMAEVKFLTKPNQHVWESETCSSDMQDLAVHGSLVGLSPEAIIEESHKIESMVAQYLERPAVV